MKRGEGNLYFWCYGTLAAFLYGGAADGNGEVWQRWNTALKETLVPAQQRDGSFEPIGAYVDYAGDDERDRSFSTAMAVLSLEVYYRYFTPLLKGR